MTTSSPLRIAILGAGRIGSTVAFQLARVGRHDVTVVVRPGSTRFRHAYIATTRLYNHHRMRSGDSPTSEVAH